MYIDQDYLTAELKFSMYLSNLIDCSVAQHLNLPADVTEWLIQTTVWQYATYHFFFVQESF